MRTWITWVIFLFFLCSPIPSYAVNSFSASSVRTVYTGSNVTTSTSLQLVASMPYPTTSVAIFDSSGQTMQLVVTTSGGVITNMIIPPGGGAFPLKISGGDVVSIIALSGNPANTTENDINFFY